MSLPERRLSFLTKAVGDYIGCHARRFRNLSTLAHFHPGSGGLTAHDRGIDPGKEVRHHGFPFFVDNQKIKVAVTPRDVTIKAHSKSQDDFSYHGAPGSYLTIGALTLRRREAG